MDFLLLTLLAAFPALSVCNTWSGSSVSTLQAGDVLTTSSITAPCPSVTLAGGTITRRVTVGARGSLRFEPDTLDADVGDVVEFTFLALNHTLTQSSLAHPCESVSGFDTGFRQFNPKNESKRFVVKYEVDTLDPQWFFCAQSSPKSHCQAGMVFALNPGSNFGSFLNAASLSSVSSTSSDQTALAPQATAKTLFLAPPIASTTVSSNHSLPTASTVSGGVRSSNGTLFSMILFLVALLFFP